MDPIEAAVDDRLLRYSDGVVELFARYSFDSTRIPVSWLAVRVGEPKRGQVRFNYTRLAKPEDPLYQRLSGKLPNDGSSETIPEASEPVYREFFTRVAALTGRIVIP